MARRKKYKFWHDSHMNPRMAEFKKLHRVRKVDGKKVVFIKKGHEQRARELWTEMYHPINKLIYHVIKKSCRHQMGNPDLVAELHIRARDTIVKYIKPNKSDSNNLSYMYSSIRCGIMDYLSGVGAMKYRKSIYKESSSKRGEKFDRRYLNLGDEVQEYQYDTYKSWLDQIDFQVLSEYIPDVTCGRFTKELAYEILSCMDEVYNGPIELKGNNLMFGLYEMVRSKVNVTVTAQDLKLARAVLREAYSYYREDEVDFHQGEVYGNLGAVTPHEED